MFLLRVQEAGEPIAALSGSQDGVILDVQWCPGPSADTRSLVMLQGPQPALVSVFSYRTGGGVPSRTNLGNFGVRNSLRWDPTGRSFCLRVRSLRGAGVSSEADCVDIFDFSAEGAVARRAGAAVGGKRDKEQAIGPSIASSDFSPDGGVLLLDVEAHFGAELKFVDVREGNTLYRLKFEEVYAAQWQPVPAGAFAPPTFPVPPPEARFASVAGGAILDVQLREKEAMKRRVKAMQARLRDIERLKARHKDSLDAQQKEKVACEEEARSNLLRAEAELEVVEQPDVTVFEIKTQWGIHCLELRAGLDSCRELAKRFCRERRLDAQLAGMLAELMEQRYTRPSHGHGPRGQGNQGEKSQGPKPKAVDKGDVDAVRRRVRALQKKIREIKQLKTMGEGALDNLQREKLSTETQVRGECAALEKELDLLERGPFMVFDIEVPEAGGVRYVEYREGDSCVELARQFVEQYRLDQELVEPLAQHMEMKLEEELQEQAMQEQGIDDS